MTNNGNQHSHSPEQPFFVRYLEGQFGDDLQFCDNLTQAELDALNGGSSAVTLAYPSGQEGHEGPIVTLRYPSDAEDVGEVPKPPIFRPGSHCIYPEPYFKYPLRHPIDFDYDHSSRY
jgi:hypothetical protein